MTLATRRKEMEYFSKAFGLSPEAIRAFVRRYNSDFSAYDNSIYQHVGSRIAHWWNYANHGWFDRRIDIALNHVESILNAGRHVVLVDVGFSVPYAHTRAALSSSKNLRQLLVDKEDSARAFHAALVTYYKLRRRADLDKVELADVEQLLDRTRIATNVATIAAEWAPTTIVIIASEVIEHLTNPETFWQLCSEVARATDKTVTVYATLPVGDIIPSHSMAFRTTSDALDYLGERMDVDSHWLLHPRRGTKPSPYLTACVCAIGTVGTAARQ